MRYHTRAQSDHDGVEEIWDDGDVFLTSDQAMAITTLVEEVCRARVRTRPSAEKSAQGDSRAIGRAERVVQSVEEMIRVHNLALEKGDRFIC